jgi:tetratricopeptide (TPR) repeat protein
MSLDDPLSPQPPSIDKRWLQVAVQRGQRALSARQSAAVKTIANEITQRVPQRPEGWVLLARDSQQQCDPKAMVRYAQRAQKAAPTQLALKVLVIEATIANGAIAQAIALLDDLASQYARLSSAQHAPSQAGLRQVATLYTQLGRHHDAYRCIARLVSQTNVEPASYFMLAQAALTIGRLDEARGILDSVIAANSNEAEAQLARSNLRRVNVEHNHINSLKQSLSGLEPRDAGFVPLCYALGKISAITSITTGGKPQSQARHLMHQFLFLAYLAVALH